MAAGVKGAACSGLQSPGPNNQQLAFKGKVIDQSRSGRPVPAADHHQPADRRAGGLHGTARDGGIRHGQPGRGFPDAAERTRARTGSSRTRCTRMTDATSHPAELRTTTLTLIYPTLTLPSWSAGSLHWSRSTTRPWAAGVGGLVALRGRLTTPTADSASATHYGSAKSTPPPPPSSRLRHPPQYGVGSSHRRRRRHHQAAWPRRAHTDRLANADELVNRP